MSTAMKIISPECFVTRWIEDKGDVSVVDFLNRYKSLCSEDEPIQAAETRIDRFIAEFCQPINYKHPQRDLHYSQSR